MSIIWTICGAGSGVGKTTFALNLSKNLPESIYVKCGHGTEKTGKPGIFFNNLTELNTFIQANRNIYKHIIIESNAFAKLSKGSIIIFLDGITGHTNFRSDARQLAALADIKVDMDSILDSWKKLLSIKVGQGTTCDTVCNLLVEQKKYFLGLISEVQNKK